MGVDDGILHDPSTESDPRAPPEIPEAPATGPKPAPCTSATEVTFVLLDKESHRQPAIEAGKSWCHDRRYNGKRTALALLPQPHPPAPRVHAALKEASQRAQCYVPRSRRAQDVPHARWRRRGDATWAALLAWPASTPAPPVPHRHRLQQQPRTVRAVRSMPRRRNAIPPRGALSGARGPIRWGHSGLLHATGAAVRKPPAPLMALAAPLAARGVVCAGAVLPPWGLRRPCPQRRGARRASCSCPARITGGWGVHDCRWGGSSREGCLVSRPHSVSRK